MRHTMSDMTTRRCQFDSGDPIGPTKKRAWHVRQKLTHSHWFLQGWVVCICHGAIPRLDKPVLDGFLFSVVNSESLNDPVALLGDFKPCLYPQVC